MYIAAAITALLNLAEIVYIGPRRILNAFTCVKGMITPVSGFTGRWDDNPLAINTTNRLVDNLIKQHQI